MNKTIKSHKEAKEGCGEQKEKIVPCGKIIRVTQEELNINPYYDDFEEIYSNNELKLSKEVGVRHLRRFCSNCKKIQEAIKE